MYLYGAVRIKEPARGVLCTYTGDSAWTASPLTNDHFKKIAPKIHLREG